METQSSLLLEVEGIFREVLENDAIVLQPQTIADDIEEWDSLSHIHLVVEMEKHFGIKFSSLEIQSWNNVEDLIKTIETKTST
jgi:acyl carrier protein